MSSPPTKRCRAQPSVPLGTEIYVTIHLFPVLCLWISLLLMDGDDVRLRHSPLAPLPVHCLWSMQKKTPPYWFSCGYLNVRTSVEICYVCVAAGRQGCFCFVTMAVATRARPSISESYLSLLPRPGVALSFGGMVRDDCVPPCPVPSVTRSSSFITTSRVGHTMTDKHWKWMIPAIRHRVLCLLRISRSHLKMHSIDSYLSYWCEINHSHLKMWDEAVFGMLHPTSSCQSGCCYWWFVLCIVLMRCDETDKPRVF